MCTNKVVRLTEHLDMTIAVDWDLNHKPSQTKNQTVARHVVGPDLGPNCLQRFSADGKSCG